MTYRVTPPLSMWMNCGPLTLAVPIGAWFDEEECERCAGDAPCDCGTRPCLCSCGRCDGDDVLARRPPHGIS